jgi:hypothetical protein
VWSIVCAAALTAQPLPPPPNKTVIVIFENKGDKDIIGSCCAPYLNSLIQAGASLEFWAFHHPSQPNYYELFAGTNELKMQDGKTIKIQNDKCIQQLNKTLSVSPNLGDAFGEQFTGYAEDYDSTKPDFCPKSPPHPYARRHCPWTAFASVQDRGTGSLAVFTEQQFDQLTTLSIVTPDIFDDMHSVASGTPPASPPNCKCKSRIDRQVLQGDTWLQTTLDPYVQWATTNNSLLIVTWDEDSSLLGQIFPSPERMKWPQNRIATILVGPMVIPGSTGASHYNHYDLLRTVLQLYGKPPIGGATTANLIEGIWKTP